MLKIFCDCAHGDGTTTIDGDGSPMELIAEAQVVVDLLYYEFKRLGCAWYFRSEMQSDSFWELVEEHCKQYERREQNEKDDEPTEE